MVLGQASLMKVEYVFEIARKDPRFFNDLTRDPYRTLEESGIDLSRGEVVAILDIVKDTSNSTLAPKLGKLRTRWNAILKDESQRFAKESGGEGTTVGKGERGKGSAKKGSTKGKS